MRYIRDKKNLSLNYYAGMKDTPLSDLLRQDNIKTENQLMAFYYYSWKDFPDTERITGEYIIFYKGGTTDHGKHVPVTVAQLSTESEYNAPCTAGMALSHFRILIHELLNKDPYIVPEEAPIIILDIKSDVCMAKNGKDTKHTTHISRRVHLVRNGEKWKMHKIDWCGEGLKLAEITTKNAFENDLNTIMKYIMVTI